MVPVGVAPQQSHAPESKGNGPGSADKGAPALEPGELGRLTLPIAVRGSPGTTTSSRGPAKGASRRSHQLTELAEQSRRLESWPAGETTT